MSNILAAAQEALSSQEPSSNRAPADLDAFTTLRLRLLVAEWASSHLISSFLDSHEANLLYLYRDRLEPTPAEFHFLLRMLINDSSGFFPGWYWFSEFDSSLVERVLQSHGLDDPYDQTRVRVFGLLEFGHVPLTDDENLRKHVERVALSAGNAEARRAGIAYLGAVAHESDLKTIGSALVDEDSIVRREALKSKYLVLSRDNPERGLKELLADSSAEIERIIPLLRKNAGHIDEKTLKEALSNSNKEVRLFAAQGLRDQKKLTKEIAKSLTNDESARIKQLGYSYLIDAGEKLDSLAIYQALPNETYTRQFSKSSIVFEPNYVDPENLILKLFHGYTEAELRNLMAWENPVGHVAYTALGLYHFDIFGDQIRKDLDEDFESWKSGYGEYRRKEWEEMEINIRRAILRDRPTGLKGFFFSPRQETDEEIQGKIDLRIPQEVDGRKTSYIAGALMSLVEHGQVGDVRFGRDLLQCNDYDIRVEAVRLMGKFGLASDAQALIGIARNAEGVLQIVAASGAMKVSALAPEVATELLETGNDVLMRIVMASFLAEEETNVGATFLEPFLYNDKDKIRLKVLAYLSQRASRQELEELLRRYTMPPRYFYDVVCWLDRILYAPTRLREAYKTQLCREIPQDSD